MSDSPLQTLGPRETLAVLETSRAARMRIECDDLIAVAHWAELHPPELLDGVPAAPGRERSIRLGGEGTPLITEFAAAEVGSVLGLGDRRAREFVAAALDLRYRLPRLWELILQGRVHGDRVCEIARRTRTLSLAAAELVDDAVAGVVMSLPWPRLFDLVDAEILRADPDRAERLRARAKGERFVQISARSRHGTRMVHARLDAFDALVFADTMQRLTEVLDSPAGLPAGVPDRHCESRAEFEAQAVGVMGKPLLAGRLMAEQEQPDLFSDSEFRDDQGSRGDQDDLPVAGFEVDHGDLRRVPVPLLPDARFDHDSAFWLARIDPEKLLPRVVLHVHLCAETAATGQGVARVEGIGPVLASQVREWLGTGCRVRLQPVVDLSRVRPVDAYEVPAAMRNALLMRTPASCFPYSSNRRRGMQPDHTIAFRRTGGRRPSGGKAPPGQTGLHDLGPLGTTEHRIKTHGGWSVRQPAQGTYVWRTPHGRVLIVNDTGTHDLGDTIFGRAVWRAAVHLSAVGPAENRAAAPVPLDSELERLFRDQIEFIASGSTYN